MKSKTVTYILSVSAKGIIPKGDSKAMNTLQAKFGAVQAIPVAWRLCPDGVSEKLFRLERSDTMQLLPGEVLALKRAFAAEKRILHVFRLDEV